MATVRDVESKIWQIEGFKIRILHPTGADARADRAGLPTYPYRRALKNSLSVTRWKEGRFKASYPDFDVRVLGPDNRSVHGRTKLSTVRDRFLDD